MRMTADTVTIVITVFDPSTKTLDLSYLNEICVVCCYGVRETFHGSPEEKEFSSRCKRRVNYQYVFFTLKLDIWGKKRHSAPGSHPAGFFLFCTGIESYISFWPAFENKAVKRKFLNFEPQFKWGLSPEVWKLSPQTSIFLKLNLSCLDLICFYFNHFS